MAGMAGHGRHGRAWPGMALHGQAWPGMAGHGPARPGMARHGPAWVGMAQHGRAWPGMAGLACHGRAWPGMAGHGTSCKRQLWPCDRAWGTTAEEPRPLAMCDLNLPTADPLASLTQSPLDMASESLPRK